MADDLFLDAARALLRDQCTPTVVRAIEAGASPQSLWAALEDAGFTDALVAESAGGAGMSLAEVFGVWRLCGACALPVPLAETMVARALLARAGAELPQGAITLAEGSLQSDGTLLCRHVRLGRTAQAALVQHAQGWSLLQTAEAESEAAAFCLDANLRWTAAQVAAAPKPAIVLNDKLDLRTLHACIASAQLAGALNDVFQRTLQYANDRTQFGRPIGKFQAIQHQLAVMSEHVFAARTAAQLGCAGDGALPQRLRVAVAKARCSQAALAVAEAGHAIHGAIGFTDEYDLQLFTRRLHAWRQTAGSESYWQGVAGAAMVGAPAISTLDLLRATTDIDVNV